MEPPLAVSTYCRKCSSHFKIENGQAVSTSKKAYDPFAQRSSPEKPDAPKEQPEPAPKNNPPAKPVSEKKPSASPSQPTQQKPAEKPAEIKKVAPPAPETPQEEEKPTRPSYFKPPAEITPETKKSSLFSRKQKEARQIRCFDCRAEHTISPSSTSALCPKCGTYISLKDYEINERWNRRIQTRGDVFIQKKGIVSGTTIQCHHLTLEGDFTGGVECSGDLIIRRNGKIMGKVVCRKLIIEKRANVEFLNSVECEDCTVDGLISGNIHCSGLLSLKKKAILTGNIKIGRLAIAEGAQHHGQIQMGG